MAAPFGCSLHQHCNSSGGPHFKTNSAPNGSNRQVMVEDPDRQRAFKKAAKQLKGKDPSAKLDAIAACSDHTFLIEVKVFLMYLKESSLNS